MRSFGSDFCRGGAGNNEFTFIKVINAVRVCITNFSFQIMETVLCAYISMILH